MNRDTHYRKLDISYLMLKEKRGCHFSVSSQQCYRFNSESQDTLVFSESTFLIQELDEICDLTGYSAVLFGDAASKHRRDLAMAD